jgi:hypothetical protein
MKADRDIPGSEWLVATLLIAMAQFIVAPTRAQARCGDYVIHGGQAWHAPPMAFDNDRSHWQPAATQKTIDQDLTIPTITYGAPLHGAPLHGSRCPGPNCSNDEQRPLDEPTVPVEIGVRHFGLIAMPWQLATGEPRFAGFANDENFRRLATDCHFRPPR